MCICCYLRTLLRTAQVWLYDDYFLLVDTQSSSQGLTPRTNVALALESSSKELTLNVFLTLVLLLASFGYVEKNIGLDLIKKKKIPINFLSKKQSRLIFCLLLPATC